MKDGACRNPWAARWSNTPSRLVDLRRGGAHQAKRPFVLVDLDDELPLLRPDQNDVPRGGALKGGAGRDAIERPVPFKQFPERVHPVSSRPRCEGLAKAACHKFRDSGHILVCGCMDDSGPGCVVARRVRESVSRAIVMQVTSCIPKGAVRWAHAPERVAACHTFAGKLPLVVRTQRSRRSSALARVTVPIAAVATADRCFTSQNWGLAEWERSSKGPCAPKS